MEGSPANGVTNSGFVNPRATSSVPNFTFEGSKTATGEGDGASDTVGDPVADGEAGVVMVAVALGDSTVVADGEPDTLLGVVVGAAVVPVGVGSLLERLQPAMSNATRRNDTASSGPR
jgi:hypothetical protein